MTPLTSLSFLYPPLSNQLTILTFLITITTATSTRITHYNYDYKQEMFLIGSFIRSFVRFGKDTMTCYDGTQLQHPTNNQRTRTLPFDFITIHPKEKTTPSNDIVTTPPHCLAVFVSSSPIPVQNRWHIHQIQICIVLLSSSSSFMLNCLRLPTATVVLKRYPAHHVAGVCASALCSSRTINSWRHVKLRYVSTRG